MSEHEFDSTSGFALSVGRLRGLKAAAGDVCSSCGKRALPNDPETHAIHGPNSAGNYTHERSGKTYLCESSSIWARIRFEYGEEALR